MTATQLLERLATPMLVGPFADDAVVEHAKPWMAQDEETDWLAPASANAMLLELPTVVLELVCSYLEHDELHAVEATSSALYEMTKQADLWECLAKRGAVLAEAEKPEGHTWKEIACVANHSCRADNGLIKGVRAFSSADRNSETPQNTLEPSRCWTEIHNFHGKDTLDSPHTFYDIPSFAMTLGERIQMKCGCSTGNSCYWSSSASPDQNAQDYIDYQLDGPSVVSCVQILPYRVFWHPGSPTYGPKSVYFEFFNKNGEEATPASQDPTELGTVATTESPFYRSPVYGVQNEMVLQDFVLPKHIWTTKDTVLRVRLLGRHQAQTFELPPWMQVTEEDRLPKYYCCVSYVNALGMSQDSLSAMHSCPDDFSSSTGIYGSPSLTEYVTAYYETFVQRRRS
ncbi:hypothetical protein Poli38472_003121 [Pythium oligandrum]|uniref:F-box domain-containing protein n=1 Tax=Pythium oligandrum TaxID=41045 RepID=A0A8K1FCH5_PYTOL|nr:hypothetical protein Poli38472_003121 [Pythium oligandrum]|eukprot:TMW57196.1 hypothetical protein Poli38472_003121 [Pythium oligandrum]